MYCLIPILQKFFFLVILLVQALDIFFRIYSRISPSLSKIHFCSPRILLKKHNSFLSQIIIETDMMIGGTEADMETWKAEMKQYEKSKRTKKPFGPEYPKISHVTHKDIKEQQTQFNPVLQTFKSQASEDAVRQRQDQRRTQSLVNQLRHTRKYEKPYDIINLYPQAQAPATESPQSKHKGAPIRNDYNIVSNQPLPDFFFKNRDVKISHRPQKKNLKDDVREFDIITGIYKQDHEDKQHVQEEKQRNDAEDKYWKTHDYNPVIGTYYDMNKEQEYQDELERQIKEHGKDAQKKLPPSYIYRERYIADPTKQIPEEVKQIEEKTKNAKKRYELRYVIEKEYQDRNVEHDAKEQRILKNRVHDGKVIQDQKKQFNIVSLRPYDMDYKLGLFGKNPATSTWDKITRAKQSPATQPRQLIKTSGFN